MAAGVAPGLIAAYAAVRVVRDQLFGVEPTDPATWLGVSLLLIAVGVLASIVPARRALRVAPADLLRSL